MTEIINIEKLRETLEKAQNILIVIGSDYSLDEVAAGLSLGLSLEKSGKRIAFFSPKPPTVEEASLFGIAKITNKLNSGNLIISIPDALNSVDKVTHYLEGETLNIVVHPVDNRTQLSTEKITMAKTENLPDSVILINTTATRFLDKLNTQEQKMYSEVPKIIIGRTFDNLRDDTAVSTLDKTCLSETVVWVLVKLGLPVDSDCASNLFQGIKFATNFAPPQATASTFEAAAICLQAKPVLPQITQEVANLPKTPTYSELRSSVTSAVDLGSQEDLTQPDVLQTHQKIEDTQDPVQLGLQNQKSGKINPSWVGPKIFKSSTQPQKT